MGLPFEQTPIYIYKSGVDGDGSFLDLAAVVDDFQNLRFKRGWYQPGDFQVTINKNTNYASFFQRKRIIQVGDDVTKCAVIESVENKIGPDGALSEVITVTGRELTSYLDRRIVYPPSGESYFTLASTTPVETVIKTLVEYEMGSSADSDRQVVELTIETDTGAGDAYVMSARYDTLLSLISNACLATNSGVFVYLDHTNKKWVLGWSLGVDRTTSQTTNPVAIFSTDLETVLDATFTDVDTGYKNFALVGGQGEGADRTIVSVPTTSVPTGIDRREMFVDARDLTAGASLLNRGMQKLAENQFVNFLSSNVLAFSQLVYGRDYNIGDNVTITQFGMTQNSYITTVEEYWEKNLYNLSVGFDRSSPTLPGQVSGAISQINKTLNATEVGIPIQPLTSTISSNTTYTLENIPGMKTILIPVAYLVASSGGPFTLTITTGSGTTVLVPISANGDTITSGDLLFDVYVDSSGNVTSKEWSIKGLNANGYYKIEKSGLLEQWGGSLTVDQTSNVGANLWGSTSGNTYYNSETVTFPVEMYSVESLVTQQSQNSIAATATTGAITSTGFDVVFSSGSNSAGISINYCWTVYGRWRA